MADRAAMQSRAGPAWAPAVHGSCARLRQTETGRMILIGTILRLTESAGVPGWRR